MPISRLLPASFEQPNPVNLIINGNLNCWQRATAATAQTDGAYKTADRFFGWLSGGGAYTTERSTGHLATTGHENALKIAVTTADTSIAASDYYAIVHKIEAQNLQSLQYGSSSAKAITLSFWIRATKTGTHTLFVSKNDSTQYIYVAEYTVSSSDTWEHKTITIEPDSNIKAGAGAIVNDNGAGFTIGWILKYGSNNDGTANAWQTGKYTTSNQVNNMDSTSNTWYITGVCLNEGEKSLSGNDGKSFPHETYAETLEKCLRYYEISPTIYALHYNAANHSLGTVHYKVVKRATPTSTLSSNAGGATAGTSNNLGNYVFWSGTQAGNSAILTADAEL